MALTTWDSAYNQGLTGARLARSGEAVVAAMQNAKDRKSTQKGGIG